MGKIKTTVREEATVSTYDLEGPIGTLLALVTGWVDKYGEGAMIDFSDTWDGHMFVISYDRPMTEKELEAAAVKRKRARERKKTAAAKKAERDRRIYERLKARFEGGENDSTKS